MTIDIKKNIKINETGLTEVEIQSADVALELNVDLDILQGTVDNQLFLGNSVQTAIGSDGSSTATRLLTDTAGKLRVRLDELAGTAIDTNSGAKSAGTQRVILASDDAAVTSLGIIDDWDESDRCKVNVNLNSGVAFDIGTGNASTGTPRVIIAENDVNLTAIKTAIQIIDDWEDGADNAKVNINAQSLTALKISKDANANATTNRIFVSNNLDQINGNTVATGSGNVGSDVQRVTLCNDGPMVTNITTLAGVVKTDGAAAGTTLLQVGGTDGTNAQIQKMGTDGSVYVELNSQLPGHDVTDDEVDIRIQGMEGWTPSGTTGSAINTVGGGTIGDEILASVSVINYTTICIEVKNAGGGSGNDIDRIIVLGSVSGTNWGSVYDSSTGIAWATGDGAYLILIERNAYRYLKVEALTAAGDTTVDCYICGN